MLGWTTMTISKLNRARVAWLGCMAGEKLATSGVTVVKLIRPFLNI